IWIGTRQQEVYRLDSQGVLKQKFDAGNYRIGNVYHIMEDHQGNLWFSTKGDGLVRGEPDENSPLGYRFVRFTNHPKQSGSISGNDVYCTFQDSRGRIWAGVLAGGLNLVSSDGAGQTVFRHKYNGMKRYPPYGLYMDVRNICEDKSGRIWVGTMDGLMSFNVAFESPEQIQFETYRTQPLNADVAENDIYVLFCDKRDSLWVSVFGSGVNKLTAYDAASNTPTFKRYGLDEGLNSDVVISVAEDRNKNLWLVSEAGLSSLNPATGRIHNYEKYDSFYDMKMEEGALLYTLGGELWIGCREGILVLNPEKMKNEAVSYPTYIVDFRVSNRDLRTFREHPILNKSIRYADSLTLKHNQSMFTIEYAALNYFNQHNVTYRYLLEGYEKQWHLNGRNRIASYTNVPPGSYLFRVQSLDEGDPRMHSERTLQITVLPPWWLTWWAYSFYVLLGVALLYVILRTIFFMVKMKNDVYIGQRLAELKIKFFTNISHELRTPLTLIKAPLQELKERESLSQKGKQYVEMMEKSANQMLQLVNQILDFRKIQNGKMRLHVARIELNTLLKRLHEEFRVMAEEKSISFIFQPAEEPIFLWADRDKLEVVIRNLLSNAFKYTPQEGTIFISGGLLENNNRRCYIRVEDSGVGIPSAKLSEIFERFSQGDNSRNAAYQGTGIGLALSKELIALHHGTIHAESENRQGSVFIVELNLGKEHYKASEVDFYVSDSEAAEGKPAVATTATGATESQPDETDASLPTLLIVEDNRDLGRLLKMQLEGRYNILLAANGVDGLKAVQLHHPDIVVTDQMMPEMSGLELLEHIRGDFQISHIPVIILTARHDENEKTRAISMGANAYITKPFSKEYLVARIEQLLGERRRFRERVLQRTETPQPDSYEQFLVKKDLQLLDKIRQSIEANMDNSDFSIDTIAAGLGLSRSAFFKKVKSLTGLAPIDLIKEIRLNKALELIKTTNMSITDISFAVGFREAGYFGKCFRKKYNRTPKEVMNELRTFASRNP
ncbi:MAG: response regulator, partial [Prevotellaceae bacterium]|nr:response regulator [Prevotellaceae bacterium]